MDREKVNALIVEKWGDDGDKFRQDMREDIRDKKETFDDCIDEVQDKVKMFGHEYLPSQCYEDIDSVMYNETFDEYFSEDEYLVTSEDEAFGDLLQEWQCIDYRDVARYLGIEEEEGSELAQSLQ